MEPAAPGTEDDNPIEYSSLKSKENEEQRLLKLKAILKNGVYDNIFELSFVNGAERWFCRVCNCPVMGRVYQHELGKRHNMNLSMTNRHLDKTENQPTSSNEDSMPTTLEVAPGEPLPPGFEGEVMKQAAIQERLDGFKVGPLVALEYLVELQDYDVTKEAVYLCILCDKRGDPRTVLTHLASYNHISQYLQKHFPTCYRALAPYMTKTYKRNWQLTLQKIAEAIEKKFGRLKPFPIDKDRFERDRLQYLTMICKGKHFSEHSGYTFQELVVHEELTKTFNENNEDHPQPAVSNWGGKPFIEKPFQKRSPSPPVVARPMKKPKPMPALVPAASKPTPAPSKPTPAPSKPTPAPSKPTPAVNRSRPGKSPASPKKGVRRSLSSCSSISSDGMSDTERKVRRKPSPGFSKFGNRRRYERSFSPPRNSRDRFAKKPWERSDYTRRDNRSEKEKEKERLEKLQEYNKLSKAIENDVDKTYKNHEKNPEKHPKYNDEWKQFWNKRYKELQLEGKDPSKYDFKPEWIKFWGVRMNELKEDEIKERKDGLRKRLGLPEEPAPVCFKISEKGKPIKPVPSKEQHKPLPMAAQPDQDNEVIVIDDKDDSRTKKAHRDGRSQSPWEDESPPRKASPEDIKFKPFTKQSHSREKSFKTSRRSNTPGRERPPRKLPSRTRSRSREPSIPVRDYPHKRSWSREKISRSPRRSPLHHKSRERSHDRRERSLERRERSLERRERSHERIERGHERDYIRESSFERDLRAKDRIRTVKDLPWERKNYRMEYPDYYKPPPVLREATRNPVIIPPPAGPEEEEEEEEVNLISVLRLLTALEERLGSLGPKIIDLLAQALAMEKNEANSSEILLDNEINCVMFETVKEKLKGQLLAGLVDIMQERAFKKAIKKTAALIHMAGQRRRQREQFTAKVEPLTVPGVGTIDKAAIAKQIANALVAQGKTDVTQAELEQLINAVVGMAEAKKKANQLISGASLLEQLTGSSSSNNGGSSSGHYVQEKIITPTVHKKEKLEKPNDIVDLEKLTEPLSPPSPVRSEKSFSGNNMENLSDSDLQTLLQNFKDLSTDEQMNLINYLKKLEQHEPERVEKLRQYVNLGDKKPDKEQDKEDEGRSSPFSKRMAEISNEKDDDETKTNNKNEKPAENINLDSEDEDYTFEDVVKSVSKNVKDQEMKNNPEPGDVKKNTVDLSDAKALISNLMSNLSNTNNKATNLFGLPTSSSIFSSSSTSTSFSLSTSAAASLASIASSITSLSKDTVIPTMTTMTSVNTSVSPNVSQTQPPEKPRTLINIPINRPGGTSPMGPSLADRGPNLGPRPFLGGPQGANLGPRNERPLVQYPQRQNPYGNNFQPSNNFPAQNVSYPNTARPMMRPALNPRYGGPNQRPPRPGFNRW